MDKLKPCPFCGGKAKLLHIKDLVSEFWRVYCKNEDCPVEPKTRAYNRREMAIETWNRRKEADHA